MKRIGLFISLSCLVILFSCNRKEVDKGSMRYLENDRIRLGIDLSLGGAVTFLTDQANGGENMINSYDWGRQIQLSYYSGPWPYIGPNGEKPSPSWEGLGWNPIQSGDAGGHRSQIVDFEYRGKNQMYVRSIPMQWPHQTGIAGECEFECLYTLTDNVFTIQATINNRRTDSTFYQAVTQEMPALYTNGPWYKLVTYLGDKPFQDEAVTTVVDKGDNKGWPWVHFYTPEQWVALLDESGRGIGVFQPEVMMFNAGFHGGDPAKGIGNTTDAQTGHIAPTGRQILDHNIQWTYETSFVLGTVDDIRSYASQHRQYKSRPEWLFQNSRNYWYYENGVSDSGWPVTDGLHMVYPAGGRMRGPVTFWESEKAPVLEIEGSFTTDIRELTLDIRIQPVAKSDFTDWLNWSEGAHDTQKEKQEKAAQFPSKETLHISQKVEADGISRIYRVDLAGLPLYEGAMKNLSIGFSSGGKAHIKRISFVEQ